jgi:uncharacterized protein (DUF1810 family)
MSSSEIDLDRFLQAQKYCYDRVKREMQEGHKQSCWIWFIFPQILIKKTGVSPDHITYAIHSLEEAEAYLKHPVLGTRLLELSEIVLTHPDTPINTIMGWSLDAMKFKSSMTLFSLVSVENSVFHRVLDHFFNGKRCPITLRRFGRPVPEDEEAAAKEGEEESKPTPFFHCFKNKSSTSSDEEVVFSDDGDANPLISTSSDDEDTHGPEPVKPDASDDENVPIPVEAADDSPTSIA